MTEAKDNIMEFLTNHCVFYSRFMDQGLVWEVKGNIYEAGSELFRVYVNVTQDKNHEMQPIL